MSGAQSSIPNHLHSVAMQMTEKRRVLALIVDRGHRSSELTFVTISATGNCDLAAAATASKTGRKAVTHMAWSGDKLRWHAMAGQQLQWEV